MTFAMGSLEYRMIAFDTSIIFENDRNETIKDRLNVPNSKVRVRKSML